MSKGRNSTKNQTLDTLDVKIITLLYEDGRRTNTEMAKQLRVAEATVRKRIDALLQDKVIRISAWADPLKLGFQTYANIEILVDPRHLEEAAERIAKFPEIFFLGICTGAFDILAVGLFRSNEHIYRFLTHQLPKVPGVQRTSTSNIIKTVKRDFPAPPLEHGNGEENDKAVPDSPAPDEFVATGARRRAWTRRSLSGARES